MNNEERIVKWKCPECGNYHKWVWSIYDIIGGEITMTCDNPECGRTSKMYMIVEKGGNATAFVSAFNGNVEEKLRRAAEKVMNFNIQSPPNTIDIDGVKYQRVEEEPEELKTLYDVLRELDKPLFTDDVCSAVKSWMSQYTHNVMTGEYLKGYEECLTVLEENLK
jgi:hypothetical protein